MFWTWVWVLLHSVNPSYLMTQSAKNLCYYWCETATTFKKRRNDPIHTCHFKRLISRMWFKTLSFTLNHTHMPNSLPDHKSLIVFTFTPPSPAQINESDKHYSGSGLIEFNSVCGKSLELILLVALMRHITTAHFSQLWCNFRCCYQDRRDRPFM